MTDPLSKAEQAALAALGWRDRYVRATTNMQRASATLMLTEALAQIYGPVEIEEQPQWYARTMADVRPGDLIRPKPGTPESRVTARCYPVAPTRMGQTARDRGSWHVIEGSGGHWDDHVIQPGECCVHLDGAGHRLFRPTFGVEILLAPSEVQAIELLGGWEHRERMITE